MTRVTRTIFIWLTAISVALLIAIFLLILGLVTLSDQGATISSSLTRQTSNRTSNVAVWCGAIDQLDETLISYAAPLAALYHLPPLNIKPLNCGKLEEQTLGSTSPAPAGRPARRRVSSRSHARSRHRRAAAKAR